MNLTAREIQVLVDALQLELDFNTANIDAKEVRELKEKLKGAQK